MKTKRQTETDKVAASIFIYGAPAMTKRGRKAIADWLRQQAAFLEEHGKDYSEGRYRARYYYS